MLAGQAKIRSGELKPALSDQPNPEELKMWRLAHGIPEDPTKYDLTFKSGLVVGEDDRPIIDSFLKAAHGAHMLPEQVKAGVEWFYKYIAEDTAKREQRDNDHAREASDALHAEWGNDFRGNMNRVMGLLDSAPKGLKDKLVGARLADGRGLFNDPDSVKWLVSIARELNPSGINVPGGGGDIGATVEARITEIETLMRTKRDEYNKNEKLQAELRDLYGQRERIKTRNAAAGA